MTIAAYRQLVLDSPGTWHRFSIYVMCILITS